MKLNEINKVIDFAARKKARQGDTAISVDFDLDKLGYSQQKFSDQVELLSDWITDAMKTVKIPGFTNLQEMFYYLMIDLHAPGDVSRVDTWFDSLKVEDRSKVMMLAHHSGRIIKGLNVIKSKIAEYREQIPFDSPAIDQLNYLNNENEMDLTIIRAISSLA